MRFGLQGDDAIKSEGGIMVTFKMNGCITLNELILYNCFEEGLVLDHCINLDFLVMGYCCGFFNT